MQKDVPTNQGTKVHNFRDAEAEFLDGRDSRRHWQAQINDKPRTAPQLRRAERPVRCRPGAAQVREAAEGEAPPCAVHRGGEAARGGDAQGGLQPRTGCGALQAGGAGMRQRGDHIPTCVGRQAPWRRPAHPPAAQGPQIPQAGREEGLAGCHPRPREHQRAAQGGGRQVPFRRPRDRPHYGGEPQAGAALGQRQGVGHLVDSAARGQGQQGPRRQGRRNAHALQGAAAHRHVRQRQGVRRTQGHRQEPRRGLLLRPSLPLLGEGRQREHERAHQTVPAKGNPLRRPRRQRNQANTRQTQQQAKKKTRLPHSHRILFR